MKALNLLNCMFDEGNFSSMRSEINEAISELEALQQSKQCNTCRFYHSYTGVCANDKCPLCADFVDADFGCRFHEAKDNK